MGEIISLGSHVIPAFSKICIKCKIKSDVKGQSRSVICIPPIKEECDNELIMTEFVGGINQGEDSNCNC